MIEQKSAITVYFVKTDTELIQLSNSDWKFLEGLLSLLEPLEMATVELSGDKYCSLTLMVPIITQLHVDLRCKRATDLLKKVKETLIRSISDRFDIIKAMAIYTNSTLLDPRMYLIYYLKIIWF
jgi:hypothetical protein